MAIGADFSLAPERALDYFRAKGLQDTFDYRDMLGQEHDRAFTVAKMMDLDLLADVRATVDRAIAEGWTVRQFTQRLKPELVDRGWWGRADLPDPLTGELQNVQLGSPRRLKTIFDVNMATAYAAGHTQAIQANKDRAPYLMYSAILDDRTRPLHRAWNGTVLRVDNPWWQTHTPPCGWRCRCTRVQLSPRDLERLGKRGPDATPPVTLREWTNPRTGEVLKIPAGVDPGFGRIAKVNRREEVLATLVDKVEGAPADMGMRTIEAVAQELLPAWIARPEGNFPIGVLDDKVRQAIGAQRRVVSYSADSAIKQKENHPELSPEEYLLLPELIDRGEVIQDGSTTVVIIKRFDRTYVAAVKATRSGKAVFMTSFRRMDDPADYQRLLRRGKIIREGEGG